MPSSATKSKKRRGKRLSASLLDSQSHVAHPLSLLRAKQQWIETGIDDKSPPQSSNRRVVVRKSHTAKSRSRSRSKKRIKKRRKKRIRAKDEKEKKDEKEGESFDNSNAFYKSLQHFRKCGLEELFRETIQVLESVPAVLDNEIIKGNKTTPLRSNRLENWGNDATLFEATRNYHTRKKKNLDTMFDTDEFRLLNFRTNGVANQRRPKSGKVRKAERIVMQRPFSSDGVRSQDDAMKAKLKYLEARRVEFLSRASENLEERIQAIDVKCKQLKETERELKKRPKKIGNYTAALKIQRLFRGFSARRKISNGIGTNLQKKVANIENSNDVKIKPNKKKKYKLKLTAKDFERVLLKAKSNSEGTVSINVDINSSLNAMEIASSSSEEETHSLAQDSRAFRKDEDGHHFIDEEKEEPSTRKADILQNSTNLSKTREESEDQEQNRVKTKSFRRKKVNMNILYKSTFSSSPKATQKREHGKRLKQKRFHEKINSDRRKMTRNSMSNQESQEAGKMRQMVNSVQGVKELVFEEISQTPIPSNSALRTEAVSSDTVKADSNNDKNQNKAPHDEMKVKSEELLVHFPSSSEEESKIDLAQNGKQKQTETSRHEQNQVKKETSTLSKAPKGSTNNIPQIDHQRQSKNRGHEKEQGSNETGDSHSPKKVNGSWFESNAELPENLHEEKLRPMLGKEEINRGETRMNLGSSMEEKLEDTGSLQTESKLQSADEISDKRFLKSKQSTEKQRDQDYQKISYTESKTENESNSFESKFESSYESDDSIRDSFESKSSIQESKADKVAKKIVNGSSIESKVRETTGNLFEEEGQKNAEKEGIKAEVQAKLPQSKKDIKNMKLVKNDISSGSKTVNVSNESLNDSLQVSNTSSTIDEVPKTKAAASMIESELNDPEDTDVDVTNSSRGNLRIIIPKTPKNLAFKDSGKVSSNEEGKLNQVDRNHSRLDDSPVSIGTEFTPGNIDNIMNGFIFDDMVSPKTVSTTSSSSTHVYKPKEGPVTSPKTRDAKLEYREGAESDSLEELSDEVISQESIGDIMAGFTEAETPNYSSKILNNDRELTSENSKVSTPVEGIMQEFSEIGIGSSSSASVSSSCVQVKKENDVSIDDENESDRSWSTGVETNKTPTSVFSLSGNVERMSFNETPNTVDGIMKGFNFDNLKTPNTVDGIMDGFTFENERSLVISTLEEGDDDVSIAFDSSSKQSIDDYNESKALDGGDDSIDLDLNSIGGDDSIDLDLNSISDASIGEFDESKAGFVSPTAVNSIMKEFDFN